MFVGFDTKCSYDGGDRQQRGDFRAIVALIQTTPYDKARQEPVGGRDRIIYYRASVDPSSVK